ncbi:MAG: SET domain-containing protein-lysine N-methyltransferase, partial [Bdellovibrionales bacterium]|nr:SET domain-containing protein-lysine N-methyltransferase [Bdellovibrionales bacterium]
HTRKYSYVDGKGTRIISWDLAKYVNHCCDCNSMSTGYGFEIAIRDIAEGEQITDEYGLFNIPTDIEVVCDKPSCRCVLRPSDIDEYGAQWDERIRSALDVFRAVEQPLAVLLDDEAKSQLESYFVDPANYRSVAELKRKVF